MEAGSRVTRDFIEGLERGRGEEARKALLLPWIHSDFKEHGSTQREPGKEFFLAARTMETLPDPSVSITPLPSDRKIKVYSEYEFINRNLSHPRFEVVEGMADADVLWLTSFIAGHQVAVDDKGKKSRLTSPQYVDYVMTFVQEQSHSERFLISD